jgi:hypothetical protein
VKYKYILQIGGAESADVARIMGEPSTGEAGDWCLVLNEGPDEPPTPFVRVFLGALENRFGSLEQIGVTRDNITMWVLYEYDYQCNLEFLATDLKDLGEAGISLCISCWHAPE